MARFNGLSLPSHIDELQATYKYQSQYDVVDTSERDARTIFIAIACYRDDEVLPTVMSAIKNAKNPDRLRFGVSLIYKPGVDDGYWGNLLELPNVKGSLKEDNLENVGLGKQRAEANSFYNGEHYYFQIDAHMRFDLYWDDLLVHHHDGLLALGEPKPVITGYPRGYASEKIPNAVGYYPFFNPFSDEVYFRRHQGHNNIPVMRIGLEPRRFFQNTGFPRHGDRPMGEFETIALATAVSPAQMFASGKFIEEVPADPSLRFLEEEQYYSILAFMKGYNFYVPRVTGVMHYYTEDSAKNPICDRPNAGAEYPDVFSQESYYEGNLEGKEVILRLADLKKTERTFADYEKFVGISYKDRTVVTPVDRIVTNDTVRYINFLSELYQYSTTDYITWFREPNYYWRHDLERNEQENRN